MVRKIGHPLSPEYAIGAVTEDGDVICNPQETAQLDSRWLSAAAEEEMAEARRRRSLYLRNIEPIEVQNKIAILVDDGIATGLTMEAAIHQLRKRHPRKIVVGVPVAAVETLDRIRRKVDSLVVVAIPKGSFGAIGSYYRYFEQVDDEEVIALMESSRGLNSISSHLLPSRELTSSHPTFHAKR
jgi:predicted phosphoribosyltransferase